ncbi:hypothetical protein D6029_06455 [Buttiauxella izardii]|uniref:Uncharacterized protein n=1 Tax=Buttiauxella izardii TaxID=82991 RepID=A0A3A5K6H0_9ENTR|nr:hypothetical protein D6029_06455 [Buttiauxella izardii]
MWGRWLHSQTPVTYLCKLLGICSLAAFPQRELFREIWRFHRFCRSDKRSVIRHKNIHESLLLKPRITLHQKINQRPDRR